MDLTSVRAFLFDLDGCVYTGNTPISGVIDILDHLRAQSRRLFFLTNNSRESSAEIQAKLARMGIAASADEILSGAEAAGPFLLGRFGPSSVLMTGSDTMGRLLLASGVQPILIGKPEPYLFRLAFARLGVEAGHAAMVGDDLNADVWGAARLGLKTIWLAPPGVSISATLRPDLTIRNFSDLRRWV